eukprot:403345461
MNSRRHSRAPSMVMQPPVQIQADLIEEQRRKVQEFDQKRRQQEQRNTKILLILSLVTVLGLIMMPSAKQTQSLEAQKDVEASHSHISQTISSQTYENAFEEVSDDLLTNLIRYKSACIAVGVLTFLLAVKRVKQRRDVDFKLNYHVQQVTQEEYEEQKQISTKQELAKLQSSQEYQMMMRTKGDSVENWNWQTKQLIAGEDAGPEKSPIKSLKSIDEDADNLLERALIQVDQQLKEESNFIDLAQSAVKKRRFNSLAKSARTQDTEARQLLDEMDSD